MLLEASAVEPTTHGLTGLRGVTRAITPTGLQVRNSGVRTLFLAVGGQAPRFDGKAWRYCLWEVMFPLIKYVQVCGGGRPWTMGRH